MVYTRTKNQLELYKCFIQPGQLAFSRDPSLICSVCGNGVLVVLRDRIKKVGGMAHCVFYKRERNANPSNYHVDNAIYSLLRSLSSVNAVKHHLEAQLYGGGTYLGRNEKRAGKVVNRVKKILKRLDIKIISEDIGGSLGRKIFFNTNSGETIVFKTRKVRKTDWKPEVARR